MNGRMEVPVRRKRRREPRGVCALVLAAGAALLLTSGPAARAMDCGKASGAIETAICADTALKTQDVRLGRLYFTTLKALSGRRHDTLIEDQRIWIAERSDECASATQRPACIGKATATRIAKISGCYAGAAPRPDAGLSCPVAAHASCPRSRVSASARLWAYPFLVAKLEALADSRRRDEADDADLCAPESKDRLGTPDQNQADYRMVIEGAGAGWVAVRTEDDADVRGAAHPFHVETAETYELPAGKTLAITRLLPALATDKTAAAAFWDAAVANGSELCCGDEGASLAEIGSEGRSEGPTDAAGHSLPAAWAVQPDGALKVFYAYDALGRSFLATSLVRRSVFIGRVDPRYAALFAGRPR